MAEDKKHGAGTFRVFKISRAAHDALVNLEVACMQVGAAKNMEEMRDAFAGLDQMRERMAYHLSRVETMANEHGALGIPQVVTVRYR
jgi:hypothetical protein